MPFDWPAVFRYPIVVHTTLDVRSWKMCSKFESVESSEWLLLLKSEACNPVHNNQFDKFSIRCPSENRFDSRQALNKEMCFCADTDM